jgi:hypothetical protein
MGQRTANPDASVSGYSRLAVVEFAAAAESEAERMRAEIDAAERRAARARAAIGTHRVMVAMLFTVQHRLDEIRSEAETQAAAILEQAERGADEILARTGPVLDLREPMDAVPNVGGTSASHGDLPIARALAHDEASTAEDGSSDYFAFLRGALDDREPLGPRVDQES